MLVYAVKPIINNEPPSLAFWNENVPLLCFDVLWQCCGGGFSYFPIPHTLLAAVRFIIMVGGWWFRSLPVLWNLLSFFVSNRKCIHDAYVNHVCIYDFHLVFRFFSAHFLHKRRKYKAKEENFPRSDIIRWGWGGIENGKWAKKENGKFEGKSFRWKEKCKNAKKVNSE